MAKRSVQQILKQIPLDEIESFLAKRRESAQKKAGPLLKRREALLAALAKLDAQLSALQTVINTKAQAINKKTILKNNLYLEFINPPYPLYYFC